MIRTILEKIRIEGFRGFQEIELDHLSPITLISGKNNSGKSSLLEGIFLFLDHAAPDSFTKISGFRGLNSSADASLLWTFAFHEMKTDRKMKLAAVLNGENCELTYFKDTEYVPRLEGLGFPDDVANQFISSAKKTFSLGFTYQSENGYQEEGHLSASMNGVIRNITTNLDHNEIRDMPFGRFIDSQLSKNDSALAEMLGKVELQGEKNRAIDMLRMVEPSLSDLSTISNGGVIQVYARIANQLYPLRLAGNGLNQLLYIGLSILENKNSILLIDEIETGFHYSLYPEFWKVIAEFAGEHHCQIIATTHSYECINGAVRGIREKNLSDSFSYYRIERNGSQNIAQFYNLDLLDLAMKNEMEVR